ncbi:VOC family protein [Eubacteriales bacterium OttesenSCG-928-N13]|nr:VOC family protein [Eubacteriales bacterium OttesenSCG-928-N13]
MACNCDQCGGRTTGLHHIGIYVADIEVSKAFYIEKLGFELLQEAAPGDTKLALIGVGSCVIELIQRADHAPRQAGVIDHIAISVEDIDQIVCRLIEKMVVFESGEVNDAPDLFGGIRNIFFSGPDGERLEFFESIHN